MDFELSDEQRMLADSLRRLTGDLWTFPARRARQSSTGLDEPAWQALAELGVLGLTIDTAHGGFGEDPSSLLPVHRELGRALVSGPVIPSAVVAATLLAASGQTSALNRLADVASGDAVLTLAYQEPGRRYQRTPTVVHAVGEGAGYRLGGEKTHVWHGGAATAWLVSARLPDGDTGVFLVPAGSAGVHVVDVSTIDGTRHAHLTFAGAVVDAEALLIRGEAADRAIGRALDWGVAALCAHAAGAMERLVELTADYLKTRQQFGQPLAAFQALQHRLADMVIAREMSVSMAYVAVAALTEPDEVDRMRMLASAKFEVGRAGQLIGEHSVQLHGGMGVTDELEIGDYFKRLTAIDMLWGDRGEQLRNLSALL